MCTRSIRINDRVMNLAKSHFKGEEALQLWMEKQLDRVLWDYVSQFENKGDNDNLLEKLEAIGDGPEGFLMLDTVLTPSKSSVEELRENAYFEKYGIRGVIGWV